MQKVVLLVYVRFGSSGKVCTLGTVEHDMKVIEHATNEGDL